MSGQPISSEVSNPEHMPVEELRKYFEDYISKSKRFKDNTPLGIVTFNGEFQKYMDSDTDTMWIGFALGMRHAMKHKLTPTSIFLPVSQTEPKEITANETP